MIEVSTDEEGQTAEFTFIYKETNFIKTRGPNDVEAHVVYSPRVPAEVSGFLWYAGSKVDEDFKDEDISKFRMTIYLDTSGMEKTTDLDSFRKLVELAKSRIQIAFQPY